MENKRKALGKGLEQLFSNESLYVDPIEEIIETTPKENIIEINIKELRSACGTRQIPAQSRNPPCCG